MTRSIGNLKIGVAETHLRLSPLRNQRHEKWSFEVTDLIGLFGVVLFGRFIWNAAWQSRCGCVRDNKGL
jgi:hypothetical protein